MMASDMKAIAGNKMASQKYSIQSIARKAGRIMWIFFSILFASVFILLGVLLAMSPGRPEPMLDENGKRLPNSVSEKIFININGVQQGMFIQAQDANNPVLLYLHGGMPDYFLKQKYPTGLEERFTVVWWEQRGTGLSYRDDIPKESVTQEQLIADTLEVTNYLRKRFHQDKIYLMGHSGGTFFGIQAAAQHPELYHAYIGVAQISNTLKSETLAYNYMLEQFKANGDTDMVRRLEATPVTMEGGVPTEYHMVRDIAMHKLGIGTTHDMRSIVTGLLIPSFTFREYTLGEKFTLWRGKARNGISILWSTTVATDLSQQLTEFQIPVYFFEGVYDYTCNYSVAKEYFDALHAPVKGFYTFENSAHSPIFEEPEKSRKILIGDVLNGRNILADIK
jgi:pimeloyl-ACP methyl ester carboxylesterase